jgi:hypothetical protein
MTVVRVDEAWLAVEGEAGAAASASGPRAAMVTLKEAGTDCEYILPGSIRRPQNPLEVVMFLKRVASWGGWREATKGLPIATRVSLAIFIERLVKGAEVDDWLVAIKTGGFIFNSISI